MSEPIEKTSAASQSLDQIIPQENSLANDYDIDGFLEKRKEFITKVNAIMVKGSDYHEIQGRKSLAKGGAEKIASIFGYIASFRKDQDVAEAFTDIKGLIAYVCDLSRGGSMAGQGRGAATLAKNGGDPNKTIKMAQKSAFIDAVLRASGLSDFFTQDLEDMSTAQQTSTPKFNTPQTANSSVSRPITIKQANYIKGLREQKGLDKIPDEELRKMNGVQASAEIERLNAIQAEELPTIQIDEIEMPDEIKFDKPQEESSVDKARRILDAKVPKATPYVEGHEND